MVDVQNAYVHCREVLLDRLKEAAPGRIQLLTGPRQVGKTTLLLEIAAQFGNRAVYAAGDEPYAARNGSSAAGRGASSFRLGSAAQGPVGPYPPQAASQ